MRWLLQEIGEAILGNESHFGKKTLFLAFVDAS